MQHSQLDGDGANTQMQAGSAAWALDPLSYVHPELRAAATQIGEMGELRLSNETLGTAREAGNQFSRPPMPEPVWAEQFIQGHAGHPDVKIVIINAGTGRGLRPAILNMHGGGFILGDVWSDFAQMQEIAAALDCVIVSVDYRLAPETQFPGALEDNYACLKWIHSNAGNLGVDRSRVAIMGASAGGGHAAMLAIAARDRGEVSIAFQVLIYPMLDDRTGSIVPKLPFQGAIMWTPEANRFGWTSLLGVAAGSDRVPAGSVPAREKNLCDLPPTYLCVGAVDLFADEGIAYAQRLIVSGVLTELVVVPGGFHGFNLVEEAQLVIRFKQSFLAALRQGLSLPL